jgi:hypothetical protein
MQDWPISFWNRHLYQGIAGAVHVTLLGLAFEVLCIVTGTLALPIALHVVTDSELLLILSKSRRWMLVGAV